MPPDDPSILVVDDDEQLTRTVCDILALHDFECVSAQTGAGALELISDSENGRPLPVALVDLRLPDMDGLDLVPRLQDVAGHTEIVILTGNASLESAIGALRENSYDYLVKPVSPDHLVSTVERGYRRWQHRKAEEDLFQDRKRFQLIVESFSDIVTVVLPDGTIQYQSPSAARTLGYPQGALLRTPFLDRVHPSDRPSVAEVFGRAEAGDREIPPFEFRFRKSDGEWCLLEGVARVLQDQRDTPVVIASRDVTERRRLESELVQAQKMEGIGQLAGGIAHDFNNFLTGIIGAVDLASQDMDSESEAARNLRLARTTAERATSLSKQLLTFSQSGIDRPETFDLNSVITEIGSLLRQLVGSPISLEVDTAPGPLWVHLDPGHMEQVVMNLVVNARDAMPEGGTAVLRTRLEEAGAEVPSWIVFEVNDDGQGMEEEVRRQIFSPFFTTKEAGTGLGLSTVLRIVDGADGEIDVRSAVGKGTTFSIRLPRTQPRESDTTGMDEKPRRDHPVRPDALILVVEDDDAIRSLIETALGRYGYEVHAVRSAAAADEFLEGVDLAPDLLLTDLSLPDRSGIEVARDFLRRDPGTPVVFTSGYQPDEASLGERPRFLQKPFDIQELLEVVGSSLADGPSSELPGH